MEEFGEGKKGLLLRFSKTPILDLLLGRLSLWVENFRNVGKQI